MTTVGFIGLGKLGIPVAVSLAKKFNVVGYDIDERKMRYREPYENKELGPSLEDNFQQYFKAACDSGRLSFGSMKDIVDKAQIIFVAVQTPHQPRFDGSAVLPRNRADFDYAYLEDAAKTLALGVKPEQTVSIISTVSPGTTRKYVLPLLKDKCRVVYNPFFIAMGTVMRDFAHPEFVLLGADKDDDLQEIHAFYHEFYGKDLTQRMSIESAELTKVGYNLFIGQKIVFANTMMEICHKVPGCNVDHVTGALKKATDRLISTRYLNGGMGDGGNCHIRDGVSMSFLVDKLNVRHNIFDSVLECRQGQADWLIDLLMHHGEDLPKIILGKSFKPESNITAGSAALLCADLLRWRGQTFLHYDPLVDQHKDAWFDTNRAGAYLIATKHEQFKKWTFAKGSVVIDPFRYIPAQEGVKVVPVGIGKEV